VRADNEFTQTLNTLIYLFISGQALFAGLALSTLAPALYRNHAKSLTGTFAVATGIMGVTLVLASATPLPVWVYALWLTATVWTWICVGRKRAMWWSAFTVNTVLACAMGVWEAGYQLPVPIDAAGRNSLTVLGDSLSMGAEWPGKN